MTTSPFTEYLPRDDGPDYPSTPARIFPSVKGHTEGLDVLGLLNGDSLMVHLGSACLDAAEVRQLVEHLSDLLEAAGDEEYGVTITDVLRVANALGTRPSTLLHAAGV